jgi:multiple sugar transport system permease protein
MADNKFKMTKQEKIELKAKIAEKKQEWEEEDRLADLEAKKSLDKLQPLFDESKIKLAQLVKEYEEDTTNVEKFNRLRDFRKDHEKLLQKIRIEKDRLSLTRKFERWSKRGSRLRRELFIKRQYYYLVAPYTLLFLIFTVIPVLMSLIISFTYFNLLEFPIFVGWENYMRLFVDDKVFTIAIRNTLILAVVTGPVSYIAAFVFAWLINEIGNKWLRSFMTLIFYAPSISGNVYLVWRLIFSSDIYGYANAFLIQYGFIYEPITWLADPTYIIWIIMIVQLWLSLGVSFLAFIAGLQTVDRTLYEAAAVDGIKNRWQELWYITLPQMKPQLLFGAVIQITSSLAVAEVATQIAGFPSIQYAGHTIVTHLMDYGSLRLEMGYASAIATILFLLMIGANLLIRKVLRRVGS